MVQGQGAIQGGNLEAGSWDPFDALLRDIFDGMANFPLVVLTAKGFIAWV